MLNVDRIDLYYGAAQALRSVSLKAEVGRILCVLGRNGVGKSSLLRAIVGQHGVASGSIQWNGKEMRGLPPHQRARAGGDEDGEHGVAALADLALGRREQRLVRPVVVPYQGHSPAVPVHLCDSDGENNRRNGRDRLDEE